MEILQYKQITKTNYVALVRRQTILTAIQLLVNANKVKQSLKLFHTVHYTYIYIDKNCGKNFWNIE
jgi:hypothetical protein